MKFVIPLTAAALALTAVAGSAQTTDPRPSTRDRLGQILGQIFGRGDTGSTLDAQWAAGRFPLRDQRTQFDSRVDGEVRARTIDYTTGNRLKTDYAELVDLEARYGSDGRFTTQERADLSARYQALTRVLDQGGYGSGAGTGTGDGTYGGNTGYDPTGAYASAQVASGQSDFNRRVDASVSARRISRTEGGRLRSDYTALVELERQYLNDGRLSESERADLDDRLDALDARVGDVAYGGQPAVQSPRARLDAIARALPSAGLSSSARSQLLVEHGDLLRLEAAYARLSATTEERAYLDRRIADLETRARIRR